MPLSDDMEEDTMTVSLPNGEFFKSSVSDTRNEYSFEPWDMLARLTSSISSLIYLPTSGALAATTLGSDRSPVVYLVSHCWRDEGTTGIHFKLHSADSEQLKMRCYDMSPRLLTS